MYIADCPYGDVHSECTIDDCTQPTTRIDCCQTCVDAPEIRVAVAESVFQFVSMEEPPGGEGLVRDASMI